MQELTQEQCDVVGGGVEISDTAGFIIGGATFALGLATMNPVLLLSGAAGVATSLTY